MIQKGPHKFSGGEIEVLVNDILHVKYHAGRKLTVDDVTAVRDKRIELIGKTAYYPIVDMTSGTLKFTDEAKAWVAVNNEGISFRLLDVFLVKSLVMKFKIKLYLTLFKPVNETIVVTSLDEALEVIKDHKHQAQKHTA